MGIEAVNQPNVGKKVWGYRYMILFTIWLLYLINYFDRMSVLTFLPFIQKDLQLSAVQLGWLGSIFFFGYSLAQFSAGYWADKIGAKKTMSIAIIFFTVVTFVTGYVRTYAQFIVLRLALALGEGHHFAPAIKTIANWFPMNERSRATGFFTTSWGFAPAIVPILVTWMAAEWFGGAWRPVFFVLAIPGVLGIFLLWYFVSNGPKEMLQKGRVKQAEYDLITASTGEEMDSKLAKSTLFLKDPQFYLFTFTLITCNMIYWGVATWISTFLVKQHGMNLKTMGFYASMPYVMCIIGQYTGGWIADKFFHAHPKKIIAIALFGTIPIIFYLGQVPKGEHMLLLFGLMLNGFVFNLSSPIYAYPGLRYPKEVVGRVIGVAGGCGQFGSFISPLVAGYLVISRADSSYDFGNVFLFWSILALLGTISAMCLKEKLVAIKA